MQLCLIFPCSNLTLISIMFSCCVLCRNSWLLKNGLNLCDCTENLWVLTGSSLGFLETKWADRVASEYHPNHYHLDRGGSKTHPTAPPAASWQHTVLSCYSTSPGLINQNWRISAQSVSLQFLLDQARFDQAELSFWNGRVSVLIDQSSVMLDQFWLTRIDQAKLWQSPIGKRVSHTELQC